MSRNSRSAKVLLKFRHGLGDAVQFGIVVRALRRHRPEAAIYVACRYGKHSVFADCATGTPLFFEEAIDESAFDEVVHIRFREPLQTYADVPATKVTRCLDELGIPRDLADYRYHIPANEEDADTARRYLDSLPSKAVAIHYQANTSQEKKDLPHDLVLKLCQSLIEGGLTPIILDWDGRCPFIDNETIFCPGAQHPLWQDRGTGDASLIRYLIEGCLCMVGVDSGPLHVAGATETPTIGVWTGKHPIHFYDLADNVLHLVPEGHEKLIRGDRDQGLRYFAAAYRYREYEDLAPTLFQATWGRIIERDTASSPAVMLESLDIGRHYHVYYKHRGLDSFVKGPWQRRYAELIDGTFQIKGRTVLDLGCAAGSIASAFQDLGADVRGVEISRYFVTHCPFENVRDRICLAPAWRIPLRDNQFDFVHCSQVLEHIPEHLQQGVLREIARVTRPGGVIFASMPMRESREQAGLDDVTHVCVKPRSFWVNLGSEVGLEDVTSDHSSIERHAMYQEYKWSYIVWRRPRQPIHAARPASEAPDSPPMKWLLAHWGENKKHIFDKVAHALGQLRHSCTWIPRDDMSARPKLVEAIRGTEFDALLTWQRFYPMQHDLLEALDSASVRTVYMDFGFIPHYESVVFDPAGENATSQLCAAWKGDSDSTLVGVDESAVDALLDAHAQKIKALTSRPPSIPELEGLRYPFVFVPLQRPRDSVVRYDSNVHDFGRLVRRVLVLGANRMFVIVKVHPADRDVDLGVPDQIAGHHVVIRRSFGAANEAVCDFLLSQAALIVGINSNMLFRALLFGKAVIATGRGWYSGSGAVEEADGVEALSSLEHGPINWEARRHYLGACLARQLAFSELDKPDALKRVFAAIGIDLGPVPHRADREPTTVGGEDG